MKAGREQGLARIHHLLDELSLPSAFAADSTTFLDELSVERGALSHHME